MNKQELINKLKKQLTTPSEIKGSDFDCGHNYGIELATIFARQLEEPEKPVVPQFVAEYIEYCKYEKFYALHGAYADMDDRLTFWRFKGNNSELFAKAWLYGYEIEQEKLYTVEIADAILTKITRGRNIQYKMLPFKDVSGFFDMAIYNTKLTEQEIKETDERLWPFAKEVEE